MISDLNNSMLETTESNKENQNKKIPCEFTIKDFSHLNNLLNNDKDLIEEKLTANKLKRPSIYDNKLNLKHFYEKLFSDIINIKNFFDTNNIKNDDIVRYSKIYSRFLRMLHSDYKHKNLSYETIKPMVDTLNSLFCGNLVINHDEEVNFLEDGKIAIKCEFLEENQNTYNPFFTKDDRTSNFPLFPRTPCKEEIRQTCVGDCWLQSALISIVDKSPQAITNAMKDNLDNTVSVRLYDDSGKPRFYKVEKGLPYLNEKTPLFAKHCMWVEVLRKAFIYDLAKGNNYSYKNIENVCAIYAASRILGPEHAFKEHINESLDSTEIFDYISELSNKKDCYICAGTPENVDKDGILSSHAYSVLGTKIDATANAKYIILRDPQEEDNTRITIDDFKKNFSILSIFGNNISPIRFKNIPFDKIYPRLLKNVDTKKYVTDDDLMKTLDVIENYIKDNIGNFKDTIEYIKETYGKTLSYEDLVIYLLKSNFPTSLLIDVDENFVTPYVVSAKAQNNMDLTKHEQLLLDTHNSAKISYGSRFLELNSQLKKRYPDTQYLDVLNCIIKYCDFGNNSISNSNLQEKLIGFLENNAFNLLSAYKKYEVDNNKRLLTKNFTKLVSESFIGLEGFRASIANESVSYFERLIFDEKNIKSYRFAQDKYSELSKLESRIPSIETFYKLFRPKDIYMIINNSKENILRLLKCFIDERVYTIYSILSSQSDEKKKAINCNAITKFIVQMFLLFLNKDISGSERLVEKVDPYLKSIHPIVYISLSEEIPENYKYGLELSKKLFTCKDINNLKSIPDNKNLDSLALTNKIKEFILLKKSDIYSMLKANSSDYDLIAFNIVTMFYLIFRIPMPKDSPITKDVSLFLRLTFSNNDGDESKIFNKLFTVGDINNIYKSFTNSQISSADLESKIKDFILKKNTALLDLRDEATDDNKFYNDIALYICKMFIKILGLLTQPEQNLIKNITAYIERCCFVDYDNLSKTYPKVDSRKLFDTVFNNINPIEFYNKLQGYTKKDDIKNFIINNRQNISNALELFRKDNNSFPDYDKVAYYISNMYLYVFYFSYAEDEPALKDISAFLREKFNSKL